MHRFTLLFFILALIAAPALAKKDCENNACSLHDETSLEGNAIVRETNDDSAMVGIWTTVSGTADDTGDEVCALVDMDCVDVIVVDEAGASGDELTASTCSTDNPDASVTLSLCN